MVELIWLEAFYILVKLSLIQTLNQMAPPGLLGVCVQQVCWDGYNPRECMLWEHSVYHGLWSIFSICVDHLVLTVAILNRVDITADPIDYSPSSYRKAAYRQYILWIHGYLGRGNRRVVPSCVVLAIRRWYPSPTGLYMGFREYWNIASTDRPSNEPSNVIHNSYNLCILINPWFHIYTSFNHIYKLHD